MKTPEELQLTEEQFNALVAVLGKMDRGELVHAPRCQDTLVYLSDGKGDAFNMSTWDCGTAACIGGWAERLAGKQLFDSDAESRRGLYDLLFPGFFERQATPQQAAVALRSYLETGAPDWVTAMSESSS